MDARDELLPWRRNLAELRDDLSLLFGSTDRHAIPSNSVDSSHRLQ
jgi:hypothetical protein